MIREVKWKAYIGQVIPDGRYLVILAKMAEKPFFAHIENNKRTAIECPDEDVTQFKVDGVSVVYFAETRTLLPSTSPSGRISVVLPEG